MPIPIAFILQESMLCLEPRCVIHWQIDMCTEGEQTFNSNSNVFYNLDVTHMMAAFDYWQWGRILHVACCVAPWKDKILFWPIGLYNILTEIYFGKSKWDVIYRLYIYEEKSSLQRSPYFHIDSWLWYFHRDSWLWSFRRDSRLW